MMYGYLMYRKFLGILGIRREARILFSSIDIIFEKTVSGENPNLSK